MTLSTLLGVVLLAAESLGPGDHVRSLEVDGKARSYLVHVPPQYDASEATPVVLAFHGAGTNGPIMALYGKVHGIDENRHGHKAFFRSFFHACSGIEKDSFRLNRLEHLKGKHLGNSSCF